MGVLQKLFQPPSIKPPAWFSKTIGEHGLVHVDVGASGGPDLRWLTWGNVCHFINFDPDDRAKFPKLNAKVTNYPIGLWSDETTRILYLTKFAGASSVYPPNIEALQDFLNLECHKIVGERSIDLIPLNQAIRDNSAPHFIKTDAEGADLEILKGAENFLRTSCLGVQVEVQFIERNLGSPLFDETDRYLRNLGFLLWDLRKVKFVRHSGSHPILGSSQLIFADAVYFLNRDKFFARIKNLTPLERERSLARFIAVLITFRSFDYAREITDYAAKRGLVLNKILNNAQKAIRSSIPNSAWITFIFGLQVCFAYGIFLITYPMPRWHMRARSLLKQQISNLAVLALSWSRRGGPNNAIVDDPE